MNNGNKLGETQSGRRCRSITHAAKTKKKTIRSRTKTGHSQMINSSVSLTLRRHFLILLGIVATLRVIYYRLADPANYVPNLQINQCFTTMLYKCVF